MNKILLCAILITMPLSVAIAQKADLNRTAVRRMEAQLGQLDKDMAEISLRVNKLTYDRFIEIAIQSNRKIDISKLKICDIKALNDTVPEIREANEKYLKANEEYKNILRTDPEYEDILSASRAAGNDKDKCADVSSRYMNLYDRLRESNPGYKSALNAKNNAANQCSYAATRFLLDHFQAKGKLLPTEGAISRTDMNTIELESEISDLKYDLSVMKRIKNDIRRKLVEAKYNVDQLPLF